MVNISDISKDKSIEKEYIVVHAEPILQTTEDDVPVFAIPDEKGYFPVASSSKDDLSIGPNVRIHQLVKKSCEYRRRSTQHSEGTLLCTGTLTLSDPVDGTADAVMLVGKCEETCFYITNDDASVKVSPTEFVLLLPQDCLAIAFDPDHVSSQDILHFEGMLAARTKFHDDSEDVAEALLRKSLLPDNQVSKAVHSAAVWMADQLVSASQVGSKCIAEYGESQRRVSEKATAPAKVSATARNSARMVRGVAKGTHKVMVAVTETVSNVVGGAVANILIPEREKDGTEKRPSLLRSSILTGILSISEVADGVDVGYETLVRSAKREATAYMAHKYGHEAAELTRHTAGATVHFGKAALTARRIISIQSIAKSSTKVAVKKSVSNFKGTYRPEATVPEPIPGVVYVEKDFGEKVVVA